MHPDRALLADLLIVFAHQHGTVHEVVWARLARPIAPYVRTMNEREVPSVAAELAIELALGGVLKGRGAAGWACTAAIGIPAAEEILRTWGSASP
jgi:hypothetical protein